jgi:hypothetical protein
LALVHKVGPSGLVNECLGTIGFFTSGSECGPINVISSDSPGMASVSANGLSNGDYFSKNLEQKNTNNSTEMLKNKKEL